MSRTQDTLENLPLLETLSTQLKQCSKHHKRECPGLSDHEFILACLKRVIKLNQSGRDFLQILSDMQYNDIARSTFFDALKSKRRCHAVKESALLYHDFISKILTSEQIDHLSMFPELDEYDVFSGDGHFIEHPCHLKQHKDQRIFAAGSIYIQNIRNGLIQLLSTVTDGLTKAHEMPSFKNAVDSLESIKKRIWVVDRGYQDTGWWAKQKRRGHFVISRAKSNMAPIYCGEHPFNSDDPVNTGVIRDRTGGISNSGIMIRIIEYVNPENDEKMTFYTTLGNQFRPGVICWLYFLRWKIEKAFDCFKNSLNEKKAWATGLNSLEIQGHAISIIYNFILYLKVIIQNKYKCRNSKAEKKYMNWLSARARAAERLNRIVNPLLVLYRSITRLSSQVIRLVRNHFLTNRTIGSLIPLFIKRIERYL